MLSLKSIRDQHPDDIIVLYLITDGEQTSDTARRSYSALRRYLDDSFTIGVGSDAGGKIPMASDGTATAQQSDGQWVTDRRPASREYPSSTRPRWNPSPMRWAG